MKKTVSQIYRLAFILFYIWAVAETVITAKSGILHAISAPAVLTDTFCFIAITAAFISSLIGKIPGAILRMKSAAVASAWLVLVLSTSIFFLPTATGWMTAVLLPAMAVLDYLLFDKKGTFRPYDPLLWLLALCLLFALWAFLSGRDWDASLFTDFFGGEERLLSTLLATILAGALMFGLDKLCSGKKGLLNPWDIFCWLYRVVFLVLTGWALYNICGGSPIFFFTRLKKFSVLSAFLSFLAIVVVLIICLLRFRSSRGTAPFPRLKGVFTLCAAIVVLTHHFLLKGGFPVESAWRILLYISPVMMIFDWILFDNKGKFHVYDPLWWVLIPILYAAILFVEGSLFSMYPALSTYAPELLFCGGVLGILAVGYGIYLLDICLKHKR